MTGEVQTNLQIGEDGNGRFNVRGFPWWLVAIIGFLIMMFLLIMTNPDYNRAFNFIKGDFGGIEGLQDSGIAGFIGTGIAITIYTTLIAFAVALVIGLLAGLGRVSTNVFVRNIAITYIEFIRGVPTLVLIFTVAYVIVPPVSEMLGFSGQSISNNSRGIIALSIIYGAFLAEVFRAGIESVPLGQTEAARSLGLNGRQAMRHVVLPQAIRNVLPALGNDFIAMLKDSSLISVLAVRDITQMARLHAGSTFRFRESYLVLTFLYLSMTIALSLFLRWYEKRLRQNAR
ncbi:MAG: amino acid ABC transporter permease [Anaerolineales bacterium]|uniref:amino acid ABC transporter permease n=1 Tax=Promineifilum sp. TaxID=2664178 RepID=UPI001DBDD582|nr:amino acid ABC transporter permease [Anaerolineales bacterium]MCB8935097.1 amino acid ABC transporter permease [Promineifilum sp.]MCO5179172.1 amino acid ABC transporter permease [Promineifilum sp.]